MPAEQTDLFSQLKNSPDESVAWFEKFLAGGQIWFTASDILISLGRPVSDANKRWLRDLAGKSDFILAGQKGYRAMQHATPEEIHHCAAWLEHQAKAMAERAGRIRRAAHKIFG